MRNIEKQRDSLTGFQVDEFCYSKSQDLGGGKHRQEVIYKGKTVGYLLYIEKNPFLYEEKHVIPDIEKGFTFDSKISSPNCFGWIDFKVFDNHVLAQEYIRMYFEAIAVLWEHGDWD